MAAPRFVQASAGATDATGAFTFTGVTTGAIGDIVILHILVDGTGAIAWGTLGGANIQSLAGVANTWTQIGGTFNIGSATNAQHVLYIGRRTSASAAPTFTTTANTSGDDVYGRMYEFTNVSAGTTLATVIENGTAGSTTNGQATNATVADAGVTTLGSDRLALNFVGINDDNAISGFAGETGADWSVVTTYAESGGTDASIGLQQALVTAATPGPITAQGILGGTGTQEQIAQSFSLATAATITTIQVTTNKTGTPTDNLIFEIQGDSGGSPDGVVIGTSGSVPASGLTTPGGGQSTFNINASISASTTYWIVARRDGARDAVNFPAWYSASATAGGEAQFRDTGVWSTTGAPADMSRSAVVAVPTAAFTIDGGTWTQADGTDGWGTIGFALIGTTVDAPPATLVLTQGFTDFNDPGVL